jgi:hypothetical protein
MTRSGTPFVPHLFDGAAVDDVADQPMAVRGHDEIAASVGGAKDFAGRI